MAENILTVENLSIAYQGVPAVMDVNFTLERGKVLTIVGESGSGKTTVIRALMGLLPIGGEVTDGTMIFNGQDLRTLSKSEWRAIRGKDMAMIFQDSGSALDPIVRIGKQFRELFKSHIEITNDECDRRAIELLESVSLPNGADILRRYPHELSGGQRQRVAIARAIINEPRVVLLDEPLSALDLKLRTDMQYELRELQQRLGITFVFVTHDQEEALAMSDWIFVMNEGEIVQSGTPVDIYDEPINHFVATFIGESNILDGRMIEDYLVEFNGKRFEAVDGGMRPNEPVEVVIRPEDLQITLPEEGKLQVKVDTQLFRGVHYEIIAYDDLGNEWMIHSTRKAIVGEVIGLDFEPEDIHVMRLNETEEEFDARIEEYVEVEEQEAGLINAIEEERDEENNL